MKRLMGLMAAAITIGASTVWAANDLGPPTRVTLPGNPAAPGHLTGWWWPASDQTGLLSGKPRPTVVLLHGCGGMLTSAGQPNTRTRTYVQLLSDNGWNILALDSFSGRGIRQICTRQRGERTPVNQHVRRQDVWTALHWLHSEPTVDRDRLAVIGWSNGGSTVLEATHRGWQSDGSVPSIRLAAAFYPGCATRQRHGYAPTAPLLLFLGLADDWTPAAPCQRLAADGVRIYTWEGAYHGFDSLRPVQFRDDVRRGVNPAGVHVGGNPVARSASQALLVQHLRDAFQ